MTDDWDEFDIEPPPLRRRPAPRGVSVGALVISLLIHGVAAAGIVRWAMLNRMPSVAIQGGMGTIDFGGGTAGGNGPKDLKSELASDSAKGSEQPTISRLPLPDVPIDLLPVALPHELSDLIPEPADAGLPQSPPPPLELAARFSHAPLHLPPSDAVTKAGASKTSPETRPAGALHPANSVASAGQTIPTSGVGGEGVNGTGGGAGRAGSGLPTLLPGNKPPVYPRDEFRQGITGTVTLRVLVLEDGRTGEVSILEKSPSPGLDEAAVVAVRDWRWEPMLEDGTPVRMAVTTPIIFTIHAGTKRYR